jgi:hypothetical protein
MTRYLLLLLIPACLAAAEAPPGTGGEFKDLRNFAFDPRGPAITAPPGTVTVAAADPRTLEITAGDYRTSFSATTSWTMRSVSYRGQVIDQAGPGTYLQTVVNENHGQKGPGKENDPFLGSGHRPELIDHVSLAFYAGAKFLREEVLFAPPAHGSNEVDKGDRPVALIDPIQGGTGTTVIIRKMSRFVSAFNGHLISLESSTVVSTAGIEQYARITAGSGSLDKIAYVNPLMHMLPKEAEGYVAYRGDRLVEAAAFKNDGSVSLSKPITALLTCIPGTGTGIILYHTTDQADGKVLIWNRDLDHKLYFRYPYPREAGKHCDYALFFHGFPCRAILPTQPSGSLGWKVRTFPSGATSVAPCIKE